MTTNELSRPGATRSMRCHALGMLVLVFLGNPTVSAAAERIRLAFRYDDYSAVSPLGVDRAVLDAFAKRGLPLTVGVTPARASSDGALAAFSPERIQLLKSGLEEQLIEIALHGYDHHAISSDPYSTEFRGVAFERQLQKIRAGRDRLEALFGTKPAGFIPPWNTYDANTLRALEKERFEYVSGDLFWAPRATSSLVDIPTTCTLRNVTSVLRKLDQSAIAATLVVMFHPHDFEESGGDRAILTLDEFAELLDWIMQRPDTLVTSLRSVPAPSTAQEQIRSLARTVQLAHAALPRSLRIKVSYIPADAAQVAGIRATTWKRVLGLSTSLLFVGAVAAMLLLRAMRSPRKLQIRAMGVLSIAIFAAAAYALHDGDIGFKTLAGLLTCSGALAGGVLQAVVFRGRGSAESDLEAPPGPVGRG